MHALFYTNKNRILLPLLLLFTVFQINAQSRYLENGISGTSVEMYASFEDSAYTCLGLDASYSIGGIMDIGFSLEREKDTLRSIDVIEWNYAFLFNTILIKQTDFTPLSFQLEFAYGLTNLATKDSRENIQLGHGQGFNVAGSIFRTFFPHNPLACTLGVTTGYTNYIFSGLDPLVFDDPERQRFIDLMYGGFFAITYQSKRGLILTLQTDLLYNHSANSFLIKPSLLFITSTY